MAIRRRTWFVWHSWVGLTSGLLLFVVCWSGSFAVFSSELDWLANPAIQIDVEGPIAWDAIYRHVSAARPELTDISITASDRPSVAPQVNGYDKQEVLQRVYVHPSSGAILDQTSYFNVQRFFRSFHMNLFIWGEGTEVGGVDVGYLIVTVLSLVLLAQLVTSLVFYKRWWRGFLKLERRRGAKVFWSDLHKLTGVWALWFTAVIALTGVWYFAEFYIPYDDGAAVAEGEPGGPVDIAAAIRTAELAYPGFSTRFVRVDKESIDLTGQDGSLLVRERAASVTTTRDGARVLGVQRVADLSVLGRLVHTADPLHFGNFAGLWSKAIWFLFGLMLSALCLTGAYLQWKRQSRQHGDRAVRLPVVTAYATTVAVLIASARFADTEIRSYGADGSWPEISGPVAAIIIAWMLSTAAILTVWISKVR